MYQLMYEKNSRYALLKVLRTWYSFEKAHSIIQIAREDREYEDEHIRIEVKVTPQKDVFEWTCK